MITQFQAGAGPPRGDAALLLVCTPTTQGPTVVRARWTMDLLGHDEQTCTVPAAEVPELVSRWLQQVGIQVTHPDAPPAP